MLPPETRQIAFFPLMGTLLNIAAATATAPAPSAISLCCSINARIAVDISSSLTVTISSTYLRQYSKVCSPGSFTAMPSAMVRTNPIRSILLCSIEFSILGAPLACTPYIFTFGFKCLIAKATPEISPPPPIGTITASSSGSCSSNSSPIVPCPAITSSSSKGWTKVYPFSSLNFNAFW